MNHAVMQFVPPMLATTGAIFESPEWVYEPKWDGIRCLASYHGEQVRAYSRNAHEISLRFPELAQLTNSISAKSWMIDGELVVLDSTGHPSFDLVRDRNMITNPERAARLSRLHAAVLATFDLLYLNGQSLLSRPLQERQQELAAVLMNSPVAIVSKGAVGGGLAFFNAAVATGWEGVVIKKLNSPYESGRRSKNWIKVRATRQADCVIGGYTPKSAASFGSLLVGQYAANGRLIYIGHVGTGFTSAQQSALLLQMEPLRSVHPPLDGVPKLEQRGVAWVQPSLVCAVEYLTWTGAGMLRHPVFRGLRTDKIPAECVLERTQL